MRLIRDHNRFAKEIRRYQWQYYILPALWGSLVIATFGALSYFVGTSPRMFSLGGVGNGNLRIREVTQIEKVLSDQHVKKTGYSHMGIVKVWGGSVIGFSRTPLHVGQEVFANYQLTRNRPDPTTVRLYPVQH